MKAQELRIGNFVSDIHASDTFYAKVKKLDYSRCHYGHFHSSYTDLKPIPLTEEWLLKFGFEKIPNKYYMTLFLSEYDEKEYSRQRIDFWFSEDDFQAAELCRAGVCFKRVKIKYVHQLQNLYFALTGEELTIKNQ